MIKKVLLLLINAMVLISVSANNEFWTKVDKTDIASLKAKIKTSHSLNYKIDYDLLNSFLTLNINEIKEISLPFPDGQFISFQIENNTTMAKGLKVKFQDIKTFNVYNKELNYSGKVDITHKGFHAMISTSKGTLFIDPFSLNSNTVHLTYWKKDFDPNGKTFECAFEEGNKNISDHSLMGKSAAQNGAELRIYRLAVSATGEYTQYHGGTVADGLAAIVTSVNRLNGVYEKDMSLTMVLVANNDLVVYTSPSSDPYSNPNSSSSLLNTNNNNLQTVLGVGNYDIGHVVGTGGSGLAGFGVVCNDNSKGRGTTGISNPIGDPFDIDYVAHEIGHQFGGSHTFNGNSGACFSNISNSSAYEPGSGTTIMAYAGICGSSNTQNFSNDYFHARSLEQIIAFTTTGSGNNCPTKTNTNNNIPKIESKTNNGYTIPKSTPFELEATASDFDEDAVTFCWEQYDLGPQGAPDNPSGNAPLFRSFSPELTGKRVFPQISDILNQTQTKGEILANYGRNMNFRVTVRDSKGGTDNENTFVIVNNSAGPFELTSQSTTNIEWTYPSQETITWTVANTNLSPINCDNVSIFLSLDGGNTFPILIDDNVPNNGSAIIGVPQQYSENARIKIKGNNNIFFNINEKDFKLNTACVGIVPSPVTLSNNDIVLTSSYSGTNIWLLNGIVLPGVSGQTFTPNLPGTYSVIAINNNCATVPSSEIEITNQMIIAAGVSDFSSLKVSIYPNPTNSILNILIDKLDSKTGMKFVNTIGETVYKNIELKKENKIDVSSFSKGIYYIVISDEKASYSQKIVID